IGNLAKTLSDLDLVTNSSLLRGKQTMWSRDFPNTVSSASENIVRFYNYLAEKPAKKHHEWFDGFFVTNNGFNVAMRLFAEILQNAKSNDISFAKLEELKIKDGLEFYFENGGDSIKQILK